MNYTYIVQCADGTLYTGWTNCLARRMKAHNEGKAGAKYTRAKRPVKLVYYEGFATKEEIDTITEMAFKINEIMIEFFKQCKVDLIDFKIEFGRYKGKILLADEISPDTCRFWDMDTQEKLDKDRFRRDMGGVEEAYAEMMKRVGLA